MATSAVQPSNLAGTWYPAAARELRGRVEDLLSADAVAADPAVCAAVVPHAGYAYSGRAAAAVYARLRGRTVRRVVIVAPSHFHVFAGAALFPGSGFATPLGVVSVDREAADALQRHAGVQASAAPYQREHSIEIQLPFLQVALPQALLVPLLVGGGERARLDEVADALRSLAREGTLILVSSDFTHYGAAFDYLPFPPEREDVVREQIRALDQGAIAPILRGDAEGFRRYVAETEITVCGRAPMSAFLHAFGSDITGEVACYYTSLDLTGDFEHSVSYAAILFRRSDA